MKLLNNIIIVFLKYTRNVFEKMKTIYYIVHAFTCRLIRYLNVKYK